MKNNGYSKLQASIMCLLTLLSFTSKSFGIGQDFIKGCAPQYRGDGYIVGIQNSQHPERCQWMLINSKNISCENLEGKAIPTLAKRGNVSMKQIFFTGTKNPYPTPDQLFIFIGYDRQQPVAVLRGDIIKGYGKFVIFDVGGPASLVSKN